jgi:hypothetical protein
LAFPDIHIWMSIRNYTRESIRVAFHDKPPLWPSGQSSAFAGERRTCKSTVQSQRYAVIIAIGISLQPTETPRWHKGTAVSAAARRRAGNGAESGTDRRRLPGPRRRHRRWPGQEDREGPGLLKRPVYRPPAGLRTRYDTVCLHDTYAQRRPFLPVFDDGILH